MAARRCSAFIFPAWVVLDPRALNLKPIPDSACDIGLGCWLWDWVSESGVSKQHAAKKGRFLGLQNADVPTSQPFG